MNQNINDKSFQEEDNVENIDNNLETNGEDTSENIDEILTEKQKLEEEKKALEKRIKQAEFKINKQNKDTSKINEENNSLKIENEALKSSIENIQKTQEEILRSIRGENTASTNISGGSSTENADVKSKTLGLVSASEYKSIQKQYGLTDDEMAEFLKRKKDRVYF